MRTVLALVVAAASVIPVAAQSTPRPAKEFAFHMPDGSEKLLSSYRGKAVAIAFFFTTCPHCQDMAGVLQKVAAEYKPKGAEVIAAAFNDDAKTLVPAFNAQFVRGAFPMGYTDRSSVLEFLETSIMTPLYVPIMVFVDRKGVIQDQFLGDTTFLHDPPKNVRAELDKLLAMPAPKAAPKTGTKPGTKSAPKLVTKASVNK